MKKNNSSLLKWLLFMIIGGASLMCIVIVAVGMAMYMRSVRRIYKNEMIKNAESAVELSGYDNILTLCRTALSGEEMDVAAKEEVEEAFAQIYRSADLEDLVLYCFDEGKMSGRAVVTSAADQTAPGDEIHFGKAELGTLLIGEATRKIEKNSAGGYKNTVFMALRDDKGQLLGLVKISTKLRETFSARIRFILIYLPVFVLLTAIFSVLALRSIKKRVIVPIGELDAAAKKYSLRDLDSVAGEDEISFQIPEGTRDDEIGVLWETCSNMESSIKESVKNLKEVTAEKERQAAEMEVAFQIQTGMLPAADPVIDEHPAFHVSGSMTPAKGVGGDFFDYFLVDEDHLALVIGDVSGKGIPASLFMVLAISQIRMNTARGKGPAEILASANRGLCANNPEMMFVTVWMGIFEISTGIMRQCNAGHECCAIKKAGEVYRLDEREHDMPLGIIPDSDLSEYTYTFRSGDSLFIYSDGVPEAIDPGDMQFTTDRMLECLNKEPDATNEKIIENLRAGIKEFVKDAPQFDDITMLSFTCR